MIQEVVLAIIINEQQEVCLAKRDFPKSMGGQWEFPGGKIKPSETAYMALCREAQEELGIVVKKASPWQVIEQQYSDRHIRLHCWQVLKYEGQVSGQEGQKILWVPQVALAEYPMPSGNEAIVKAIVDRL